LFNSSIYFDNESIFLNCYLNKSIHLIMANRRNFLKGAVGFGTAIPFFTGSISKAAELFSIGRSTKIDGPMIMCSRGEYWAEKVLAPVAEVFGGGGNLLDAIEKAANVTELDPEDNSVGFGGLPNEDGVVTLDSSFMDGKTHNCGSVAAIEKIKTPSSVARLVMERTDHIYLVAEGALKFARAHGFPEENLLTDRSRRIWLRWKENLSDQDDWFPPADGDYGLEKRPTGTINILGFDSNHDLAGCTTTSGLFGKIAGRIGDSPIIGAGLYVDNEVGAAGATGRGEEVIRMCGSFYVIEQMRTGMSAQEACEAGCKRIIDINGGAANVDFNDKFVAISKNGEVGCAQIQGNDNSKPQAAYWTSKGGVKVVSGSYIIKT
jgi:N4-(beta-N-acetylglucosaminyl)-L-asparaginase